MTETITPFGLDLLRQRAVEVGEQHYAHIEARGRASKAFRQFLEVMASAGGVEDYEVPEDFRETKFKQELLVQCREIRSKAKDNLGALDATISIIERWHPKVPATLPSFPSPSTVEELQEVNAKLRERLDEANYRANANLQAANTFKAKVQRLERELRLIEKENQ